MSTNHADFSTRVVIAGGGPVGVTLSILLSNHGIDNVVVERDTEVHPLPRAALMDGELVRMFIQHGVGDGLLDQLTPVRTVEYVDADGMRLQGADISDRTVFGGLAASNMHYQPDVEAFLRREMLARGARFIDGSPFTGVDVGSPDSVSLVLADGRRVTGQYLVACDGASSTVRRSLGIGWQDLGFDQDWLVVDIEVNDRATCGLPDAARQICDPRRPVTMVSGHGRYYRWELQLQPGEDPHEMNRPERVWEMLSTWITPDRARLVRSAPYRFHAVVASTMRQGRVLLAGDAGHQMPPFMGQGLNSGMRDALNAAWKLKWVLEGWSADGLLDSYSIERSEHSRGVVEQSVEAGRLIDQYAGRQSYGIVPRGPYGSDLPQPRYSSGVRWGEHPRTGKPYASWHKIVDGVPPSPAMIVVSSVDLPIPLPSSGRPWRAVSLDRAATLDADHLVVRPDGWVAAVCSSAELAQAVADLEERLAG